MSKPEWGYRLKNGEVEAKLFEDGRPSRGWADTPAKLITKKAKHDDYE